MTLRQYLCDSFSILYINMNNKKYGYKIKISWILVLIWMMIIFYLSSRTAAQSTVQSRAVISTFTEILGTYIEDEEVLSSIDGLVRECAHGIEYFILGGLLFNALFLTLNYRKQEEMLLSAETGVECGDRYRTFNCFICAWLVCCIYAITDEIHQIPVPGRTFQVLDLVIDFIGALIGILLAITFYKVKNKKLSFSSHRVI